MSEQELATTMEAALAHIDPDRRKFLGILLAGVAAFPLLTSASLTAQEKPGDQTVHQGNPAIKDGSSTTIKMNDQKTQTIKFWNQTGNKANSTSLKDAQIKGVNPAIKHDPSTIKGDRFATKGVNPAIKLDQSPIKATSSAGQPVKNISGANSTIK